MQKTNHNSCNSKQKLRPDRWIDVENTNTNKSKRNDISAFPIPVRVFG